MALSGFIKAISQGNALRPAIRHCRHVALVSLVLALPGTGVAAQKSNVADLIVTHVTVTDVKGGKFIADQTIAVRDGKIVYSGPETPEWRRAERKIDGRTLIALPGFVDTHTHLWQHVARGIAPDSSLQEWAVIVYRLAHHALPGEVREITSAAIGQGLLNGVTTVSDFASINFTDYALPETIAALRDNHVGGDIVWWRPAVFLPWQDQDREIAALNAAGHGSVSVWMGFGPLSFMPVPLVYDGVLTGKRNALRMTEHSMENLKEARDFATALTVYAKAHPLKPDDVALFNKILNGTSLPQADALGAMGRMRDDMLANPTWQAQLTPVDRQALGALPTFNPPSPLRLLDAWDALDHFLAIHSVWPTADDIALYRSRGAAMSHNPESNMYLSSGVAPLRAYRDAGVDVTLGTDGAASNDRISMFDAMRTAWLLQRVTTLQADVSRSLDAWFYLRAATINGARALGLEDRTGSIGVGKEADFFLMDRDGLSLSPANDAQFADRLVTSAEARDIRYVVADGVVMVEGGTLVGRSAGDRAQDLMRISRALQARQQQGKSWDDDIVVKADELRQYRLIKTADTVRLTIRNGRDTPLRLTLAFSGTTFGGKTPMTMHPDTVARYPTDPFPKFTQRDLTLAPGESVAIDKATASTMARITGPDGVTTRDGAAAEQILLLAR